MRIDKLYTELHKLRLKHVQIPYRLNWGSAYLDCAGQKVITSAINKYIHFYYKPEPADVIVIESAEYNEPYIIYLNQTRKRFSNWHSYVDACVDVLRHEGFILKQGIRIMVNNDLPSGVGLASSACFILGILTCLLESNEIEYNQSTLVKLGYEVEHDFLGIPCGLMDFKAVLHTQGVWLLNTSSSNLEDDQLLYDKILNIALIEDTVEQHEHLHNSLFKEIAYDLTWISAHREEVSRSAVPLPAFRYLVRQESRVAQLAEVFKQGQDTILNYPRCQHLLHESNYELNVLLGTGRFLNDFEIQMLGSGLRGYGFALLDPDYSPKWNQYKVQYCCTLTTSQ